MVGVVAAGGGAVEVVVRGTVVDGCVAGVVGLRVVVVLAVLGRVVGGAVSGGAVVSTNMVVVVDGAAVDVVDSSEVTSSRGCDTGPGPQSRSRIPVANTTPAITAIHRCRSVTPSSRPHATAETR
ncbi:MAG: hypothetical protein QOG90_1904 [Actinomycetota bacterium]